MRVWLNGRLVAAEDALVSVFDHGLTVGDGVFETTKVVGGVPFALTRHLARLRRSAQALGLALPDDDLLRGGVRDLLAANTDEEIGRLRITVTGGVGPLGSDRGDAVPTLVLACSAARVWPASSAMVTVPWRRNERSAVSGVKTTSYAENVVALAYAHERGASEALFLNTRDEVCEGTGSNVFAVLGGELVTPPLSSGCLGGVTRDLLLEWCGAREQLLTMADLAVAEEVFVSSSTRDVHPVHDLDGRTFATPGPATKAAMAAFSVRAAQDVDP